MSLVSRLCRIFLQLSDQASARKAASTGSIAAMGLLFALLGGMVPLASATPAGGDAIPVKKDPRLSVEYCKDGVLPAGDIDTDLLVKDGITCVAQGSVAGSVYVYRNVNILGGGTLKFNDARIDFHAHSILVESGGTLEAGFDTDPVVGPITIWLYGAKDDGVEPIKCVSDPVTCGVPIDIWNSNPNVAMQMKPSKPCTAAPVGTPVGKDCFYQYEKFDADASDGEYFGKKVLAVSYGGMIMLRGAKGIRPGPIDDVPSDSGTSWVRLIDTLKTGDVSFHVDRAVPTWGSDDHIVLSSTDYLPGHSEEVVIDKVESDGEGTKITLKKPLLYPHYGKTYDYSRLPAEGGIPANTGPADDPNRPATLPSRHLETRAAVALLTRSIRIASEGATPTLELSMPGESRLKDGYYGGHTLIRQGFKQYQAQGVEFNQLGQGGALGRYPVHFHMDRTVPQPTVDPVFAGTYIADSTIHDSMTRFITIHATQGLLVARNVGFASIGHGFFLEDATETNNRLYSNIGIQSRAAVSDGLNPRNVPGILSRPLSQGPSAFPYQSDYDSPSIFWIMNTWNDFRYNVAVGAGTCGACYWMPPSEIGGPSVYETWSSYASMQTSGRGGAVPLMNFVGNSCSTAMTAIQTVGATSPCLGVVEGAPGQAGPGDGDTKTLVGIPNATQTAYPEIDPGLRQHATVCDAMHQADCSTVPICTGEGDDEARCTPTTIDHFTTSFNWAQKNLSAVWLRGWWYLMKDSAITDVQSGGFTAVTGGGYTRSDIAQGFWNLSLRNLYVGNVQPITNTTTGMPDNAAASNAGPFNPYSLPCAYSPPDHCVSQANDISIPVDSFSNAQRLFNIYDGPVFEENDAFMNIHPTNIGTLADCKKPVGGNTNPGSCQTLGWENGYQTGVLQDGKGNCLLPNAAIAWKQPNGFYYPPAFHSTGLAFADVDIRHYVVEPLWYHNSFDTNLDAVQTEYCAWEPGMFGANFTDIDRQTELSDDSGSLTGLVSATSPPYGSAPPYDPTISVNKDPFFNAPLLTNECESSLPGTTATADTSPYQYVSTVVYPACGTIGGCKNWGDNCSNQSCYGVPLYRQYLTDDEFADYLKDNTTRPSIRMMGQVTVQRSNLTLNHGSYYIDTTLSADDQSAFGNPNVFQAGQQYYIFFLYARPDFKQTYSMYIGKVAEDVGEASVTPARVQTPGIEYTLTPQPSGDWVKPVYDKDTGLLTVTLDLSKHEDEFKAERSNFCKPATYCSYNSSTGMCGCAPGSDCKEDSVCSWGVKDIDCPVAGCFGFSVTMPSTFVAAKQPNLPPAPIHFTGDPDSDPYFNKGTVTFNNVDVALAGSCHYDSPPMQP